MSADAYESVARSAKTLAGQLRACPHPALAGAHSASKSRKWRVLLSIGLLLPTLAAIIGIVAWTISIEVASGSDHLTGSRKLQSVQHRPHPNHQPAPQFLAFRRHVNPAPSEPEPADVPAKRTIAGRRPKEPSAGSEGHQKRQLVSQVDSRLASRTASVAGPSEASNELRKASSSAAKTSESSTAGRHREAKQSDDGQEDVEANQREANLSVDQTATATGKSNSNAKKRQTSSLESPGKKPAGEQDDPEEAEDAGSAKPAAADPDAPSGLLLTNIEQARASKPDKLAQSDQDQPDEREAKKPRSKSSKLKSRWLDQDQTHYEIDQSSRARASNQEARDTSTSTSTSTDADQLDSEPEPKATKKSINNRLMMKMLMMKAREDKLAADSKYIIVDKQASQSQSAEAARSEEPALDYSTTTEAGQPADADNNQSPLARQSSPALPAADEASSAELGFEAIASAISTSLTKAHSAGAPEGDTGLLNGDAPDELVAGRQVRTLEQVDAAESTNLSRGDQAKRRTTGEHVAEVIDHIVERRRQANKAANVRGPQIVVVAPVGGSDAMKARSLTKAASGAQLKERKAAELPASAKKDAMQRKRSHAKKPLGARLLGTQEQQQQAGQLKDTKGEPIKFSERVEVIQDDDSSSLLAGAASNAALVHRSDEWDEPTSLHVAGEPDKVKLRTPRHGYSSDVPMFERYAPAHSQTQPAKLYSTEQLIREHVLKSKSKYHSNRQQSAPMVNMTSSQSKDVPAAKQQEPTSTTPSTVTTTMISSTSVPIEDQSQVSQQQQQPQLQSQSQPQQKQQQYFQSAGVQPVQVPLFIEQRMAPLLLRPSRQQDQHQHNQVEAVQGHADQQPAASSPDLSFQQHQQGLPGLQEGQQSIPYIADQEYNVPAHMAESVIQEIQRSPAATLSMVNGQPTLSRNNQVEQASGQQVPLMYNQYNQAHHMSNQQQQYNMQTPQPHQAFQPFSARPHLFQPLQQPAMVGSHHQQPQWDQMMAARMAAIASQDRQVLANRDSSEVKSKSPARSLVSHPMAQMAIRHLFSNLGREQQSSAAAPVSDIPSGAGERQQRSVDMVQGAGSAPVAATAEMPTAAGSEVAGRSMQIAGAQHQQPIPDQEVQESYNQMPAYQMGGYEQHGGGGGYGGGQQHYGDNNDKKSKGVTFHFGGGPIGGGTQLITSPMGIFKHLMIPLLPNPRVNLNGKVVFGVVLEKTTAFGEPKKKYKFWG